MYKALKLCRAVFTKNLHADTNSDKKKKCLKAHAHKGLQNYPHKAQNVQYDNN